MKTRLAGAALVVGLILLGLMLRPTLAWNGARSVEVRFHVLDSNGTPLSQARILVLSARQDSSFLTNQAREHWPWVRTDDQGKATVRVACPAGGSSGGFRRTGRFRLIHELRAEAPDCVPVITPLSNVVGGTHWPLSKRGFDVRLVLFRDRQPSVPESRR